MKGFVRWDIVRTPALPYRNLQRLPHGHNSCKEGCCAARTLLIKERSSRGGHLFATIKTYEGIRKVGYPNDPDLESFLYIRSPNGGFRRMDIGVEWISAEEYPDL